MARIARRCYRLAGTRGPVAHLKLAVLFSTVEPYSQRAAISTTARRTQDSRFEPHALQNLIGRISRVQPEQQIATSEAEAAAVREQDCGPTGVRAFTIGWSASNGVPLLQSLVEEWAVRRERRRKVHGKSNIYGPRLWKHCTRRVHAGVG
jgi:hypothetical protein